MYSHDSYGLGHLRRTLALAKAFVEHDPGLGVLILTGSTVSGAFRMPQGMDIVKLPSPVKVSNGVYKPGRLPITFQHLRKLRSGLILNAAESLGPDAFIVDKAPLGMKREVSRTLEYLHNERPSTLTVLGLRDVLDDPDRVRRHWRDNHITEAINRYYDLILVYGPREVYDPLPEYGLPTAILRRSHYVGYVGRGPTLEDTSDAPFAPGYVLVTAGGEGDGFHLIRNYLESLREPVPSFQSIVVTGPLMDEESMRTLEWLSWGLRARVLEFRADMECLIERAGAVVAMGGRPPGLGPLRHHHQGEHRLREAGRHHGGDYPGRQSSQRPRLHHGPRGWVRDRHRRAGRHPLRRAAPEDRYRAGRHPERSHPDPGRADGGSRRRERGEGPGSLGSPHGREDVLGHYPRPPRRGWRGPHPGSGGRPDSRTRKP